MATRRTLDFLPTVFQTDTNKKFLQATLDQLVSEPNFDRIDGYVGRQFAPTYKANDSYISEANKDRQNYQLEPSVLIKGSSGEATFYSNYSDLANKISYYGGVTNDHRRLFSNEYYTYTGLFDLDKFVNFSQYYWLPNGPSPIAISSKPVSSQATFTFTRDEANNSYTVAGQSSGNPELVVARGGFYKFVLNQPNSRFYIQTEPGVSGVKRLALNTSTRDIYGITANGVETGTIEFTVPLNNVQDRWLKIPLVENVDYATDALYQDLVGTPVDEFKIDGSNIGLNGKNVIFLNPADTHKGVYRIRFVNNTITFDKIRDIDPDSRVYVRSGLTYSNNEYYKTENNQWEAIPSLTAQLDVLYYQDATNPNMFGKIKILETPAEPLNIDELVIGKTQYTTQDGIQFTNGLVVKFDDSVLPAKYQNKTYIVEGVGSSITLVDFSLLVFPEPNAQVNTVPWDAVPYSSGTLDEPFRGPAIPDYFTSNRASIDLNAWARHNRWFHSDVIELSAKANGSTPLFDQAVRAQRPIIEAEPNVQLFQFGRVGKRPVNHIDVTTTDAFNQVQHSKSLLVNGVRLKEFDRILFANDKDPLVRSQIYTVRYQLQNEPSYRSVYDGTGRGSITRRIDGRNDYVEVIGSGTDFTSELDAGSTLYDAEGNYLGTVTQVMSSTSLGLIDTPNTFTGVSVFQYRNPKIQLTLGEADDAVDKFDCVVAIDGESKGKTYWYNGDTWQLAQQKSETNQILKFDAFDNTDTSFGSYNGTNFTGTNIFSYKTGSGKIDAVLGQALAYENTTNNTADLVFDNNFDNDTFTYVDGTQLLTKSINSGYIRQNVNGTEFVKRNVWAKVVEDTKQYQIFSKTYTGKTNHIEIDVLPESELEVPTTKVFVNNKLLESSQYSFQKVGKRNTVKVVASKLAVDDKIDVLIYSKSASKLGYYQVPANLEYNSQNKSFSKLTLGQIRNHLTATGQNTDKVSGLVPGPSNLRDLNIARQGGNILQHSAPTIYASLFLIDKQANYVNGIEYARREYTKFKNKFIELASTLPGLDLDNAGASVDIILSNINAIKNPSFSWHYSDMVPYGDCRILTYKIKDTNSYQFKIDSIFNDKQIQNRAVLVYLNNQQLIKDIDYTFDQTRPAVILNERFYLTNEDVIEIRDYKNTDGCYIPETPTKLGLHPKFKPTVYLDDTYREAVEVIQGHDGSLTPVFGDYRDSFLLELELRIYNNIKIDCKVHPTRYSPGQFRTIDYTPLEWNKVLNSNFLKWVGQNKLDFIANDWFDPNDPFTYNYRYSKDSLSNQNLNGYWRGIYRYFYDTDRPHIAPWEMLGFSEQPTWWENIYGPAPYTKYNTQLWSDLENGVVASGTLAGIDSAYIRPGLSKIIPVDENGGLLHPLAIGISTEFNSVQASSGYQIGDGAPIEAAWQRTSEYPYALQRSLALTRPAWYFGTLFDVNGYAKDAALDQYTVANTSRRVAPKDIVINGETVNNQITRASGYINWITDYMTSLGLDARSKLRNNLDNLTVELSYRVGGFTDKNYITVLAEQYSPTSTNASVVVPNESYSLILNKNVPKERVAYSAVIIEKTSTGFAVSGYNLNYPYFTVVPSDTAGESYAITQDGQAAMIYKEYRKQKLVIPYGHEFTTKQQVVDFLVSHQRYLLSQGFIFDEFDDTLAKTKDWVLSAYEFLGWTIQGWKPGSILILSPVSTKIKLITADGVVDEITNESNGTKILDPNFSVIRPVNFTSVREPDLFTLDTISGQTIAFLELDIVQYEHVLRFDNSTVFNDIIYQPESGSRQFRLKIVGSKTANWTGALNPPGFIYNNPTVPEWRPGKDYLKGDIVTYKSQYYTAAQKISAQTTFVQSYWKQIEKTQIKTGLLSNFANNAGKFVDVYDPDSSLLDHQMARMSAGLIGFRQRAYLDDFYLDTTTQSKFYQGFIKQKGTKQAIDAMLGAQFGDLQNNIQLHEEWGVRVGEYGALSSNQTVEIVLKESEIKNNPTGITIEETPVEALINVTDKQLWSRPLDTKPIRFLNRVSNDRQENDLQTAGYVNINDVDATLFSSGNYQLLTPTTKNVGSGYIVWVAKDHNKEWNVYRATETDASVLSIEYSLDQAGKVTTKNPHKLEANQTVVIRNLNNDYDGFYIIKSVLDRRSFTIGLTEEKSKALKQNPVTGAGILFVLDSVRFTYPGLVNDYTPPHGWKDGDMVWVDNADGMNRWAVYEKDSRWHYIEPEAITLGSYKPGGNYGTNVRIDDNNRFVIVSSPGAAQAAGRLHVFDYYYGQKERAVLSGGIEDTETLGTSLDIAQNIIVAGAPDSRVQTGLVMIYAFSEDLYFEPVQVLTSPGTGENPVATEQNLLGTQVGARYGFSLAQSRDSNILYVGSPGTNEVFIYAYHSEIETRFDRFSLAQAATGCTLPYELNDERSIAVYLHGIKPTAGQSNIGHKLLILGEDYSVVDNTVVFMSPLVTEDYDSFVLEDNEEIYFGSEDSTGSRGYIVIRRRGYYEYAGKIAGNTNSKFGYSVATGNTGAYVVIGAPDQTIDNIPYAGQASIYATRIKWIESNGVMRPDAEYALVEKLTAETPTYKANFGYSVEMGVTDSVVFVGAPGFATAAYDGGTVYRYINYGKEFGTIVGSVIDPVVAAGDLMVINEIDVLFTGGDLTKIIKDINNKKIIGVQASATADRRLVISSILQASNNKLNIIPTGNIVVKLGIKIFETTQKIKRPSTTEGDNFGSLVRVDNSGKTLTISSRTGTIYDYATYDNEQTTYDGNITRFVEIVKGSGAVYMYNLFDNPNDAPDPYGNYVFGEEFNAPGVALGDRFGIGVDFNNSQLWIGAAFNDTKGQNAGQVYKYTNESGNPSWYKKRAKSKNVDVSGINGISLYKKTTGEFITSLDYIDPVKGKNLGIAEQDISYKTSRDPAVYNNGSKDIDFYWSTQQVGETWWNLDRLRYIDYEQEELSYRLNNWGRLFTGSKVEVYQWIESGYLPSEYVANGQPGTPLAEDNSSYTMTTYVDVDTGIIKTRYYYWVRGISTVPVNSSRKLSALALENVLLNPLAQNLPYAAILDDHSIGIFNCVGYLNSNDTILRIDYDKELNNNLIHSEYELIQENNPDSDLPDRIYNKLVDSISGRDKERQRVPDVKLRPSQQVGLELRPRQTIVLNRYAALKNLVEYCNRVFAEKTIAYKLQNSKPFVNNYFFQKDPLPSNAHYDYLVENLTERDYVKTDEGIRVCVKHDSNFLGLWTIYEYTDGAYKVIKNQTFDTTMVWDYVNWYAIDFDSNTKITYTVDYAKDLEKLYLKAGDIVKITNGSNGYEIYRYTSSDTSDLVAVENGTVALSSKLWDIEANDVGFDSNGLDSVEFDLDYSTEIRNVINGLRETIFVDDLIDHRNKVLFSLINYIYSEQKQVDWIFKTSFVSVTHQIKQLDQYPNFSKDNQTYYEDYIKEVKPYRTKLRDYRLKYTGTDTATLNVTDFDIPGHWDSELGRFRSPSGEIPEKDSKLWLKPEYQDWANNFTYGIETITMSSTGIGYNQPPVITIVSNGDKGAGAVAEAVLDSTTGAIIKINVVKSGQGYKNTPLIVISGDGAGAVAVATLANNKIRSIKTTLKFDRTSYTTSVREWVPFAMFGIGDLVAYKGVGYKAISNVPSLDKFDPKYFVTVKDTELVNANDRIAVKYQPTSYQIQRDVKIDGSIDLTRLIPGTVYDAHKIDSTIAVKSDTDFDVILAENSNEIQLGFDTNISGGAFYDEEKSYAPEELVPGVMYDHLAMTVITDITVDSQTSQVAYRISKDINNNVDYEAVAGIASTTLAQDLAWDDTKIYVTSLDGLSVPNPSKGKPCYVYVNGEKISYYQIDQQENYLHQIRRGIGGTGTPLVHQADSKLYNASSDLRIPNVIEDKKDNYKFNSSDARYTPSFTVLNNQDFVTRALTLFISENQLTYGKDYIITLTPKPNTTQATANVVFTDSAKQRYVEGLIIRAVYTEHTIWLNPGINSVTDGTGLDGSTTDTAEFIKGFSYF